MAYFFTVGIRVLDVSDGIEVWHGHLIAAVYDAGRRGQPSIKDAWRAALLQ